jgi:hypothetical protein
MEKGRKLQFLLGGQFDFLGGWANSQTLKIVLSRPTAPLWPT